MTQLYNDGVWTIVLKKYKLKLQFWVEINKENIYEFPFSVLCYIVE